ncbi:MAG TPA: hypothetical protein VNT52_01045 [Acidimicrobiales bacterium]|nr:hypothetical protein [Acidimicrobiales bacterium]
MGAKVSEAMLKARKQIEKGATAYRAAQDNGLTVSAITRSVWYREHFKNRPGFTVGEDDRMPKARFLVVERGFTAYAAAKATGLSQSSISRAQWYREHIEGGKRAKR